MSTAFIYDPLFLDHDTGVHPESPKRLEVIRETLEADETLWPRLRHRPPRPALDTDLTRCHSEELIVTLQEAAATGVRRLDADTAISPGSYEAARLAAGAAITAVDLVFTGEATSAFAAVRPPGHHARPAAAMGFCLFNNAAIAARYAQARYDAERVLIVDWDVHHGNGTQEIFYRDPSVFFFSTHQYPYYPGTGSARETGAGPGEGFTLNVPLEARTLAAVHREAFIEALQSIEKRFPPDLIIISAGFDSRRDDPLGGLLLEDHDFSEMTKVVLGLAERRAEGRVVSLLEGGYDLKHLGGAVRRHVAALVAG